MSILHLIAAWTTGPAAPASTGPTTASSAGEAISDRAQLLVLVTLGVISLTTAALCGCFRRRSINGPNRIGPQEAVSALWMVFLFAAGFWFAVPVMYGMVVVIRHPPGVPVATTTTTTQTSMGPMQVDQPTMSATETELSPHETVWIGIAATVAGLAAALAGTKLRRDGFARLGLTRADLGRAIVPGVLGVIIVLPLVFAASELTELLWQAVRLEHPSEHELLHILGESTSAPLRIGVIVSALVLAPVFEELLFRGYLQTALLGLFSGHRPPQRDRVLTTQQVPAIEGIAPAGLPWPAPPPPPPGLGAPVDYALQGTPVPPAPAVPRAASRWGAVICASIAFALVHVQFWMMPPIFVLSLCLGYAYERTGKLWVSMLIHAAFNTVSLVLFLAIR